VKKGAPTRLPGWETRDPTGGAMVPIKDSKTTISLKGNLGGETIGGG